MNVVVCDNLTLIMDTIRPTIFKNGYWTWDEVNNGLLFVSRDLNARLPSLVNISTPTSKGTTKQTTHEIKFRETVDNLEQVRFRRHYQRRCKPNEPHVVTMQDIKDIAIFIANIKDLSPEFIKYFHIPTMDRFLRALIVYFQYYVHVWDYLLAKREEASRKLYQPSVTTTENIIRDDLADLRAMVAREYCSILIGTEDAKKFHHMNNKNNVSLSDKDRRLFETLICMAVRVVWIALQRKNLSLIELEMNRLLRTDIFNIIIHRGIRGGADLYRTTNEEKVLTGVANTEERKLLHRSAIAKELVLGDHDHRMLIIGTRQFEPTDERLDYLEIAFSAPEELLLELGVPVGMLGIPREDYDAMLMNMERSVKRRHSSRPRVLLEFKLPPRVHHSDDKMPKEFPEKPSKYKETQQTIQARKIQCKMWQQTIEKISQGREMSIIDLSISQSHVQIFASRSSVSIMARSESIQREQHLHIS